MGVASEDFSRLSFTQTAGGGEPKKGARGGESQVRKWKCVVVQYSSRMMPHRQTQFFKTWGISGLNSEIKLKQTFFKKLKFRCPTLAQNCELHAAIKVARKTDVNKLSRFVAISTAVCFSLLR